MKREWIVLIATIVGLWGCAPGANVATDSQTKSRKGVDRLATLSALSLSSNQEQDLINQLWRCPDADSNVTLKSNIGNDGFSYGNEGNFKVCVSRTNSASFRITGSTTASAICIYPMYAGYKSEVKLVDSTQCLSITGKAIEVQFSASNINYMSIVDMKYSQQMNSCLSGPTSCPPHSEGFVQ